MLHLYTAAEVKSAEVIYPDADEAPRGRRGIKKQKELLLPRRKKVGTKCKSTGAPKAIYGEDLGQAGSC